MAVNILLSFAQFKREVIGGADGKGGKRVREKTIGGSELRVQNDVVDEAAVAVRKTFEPSIANDLYEVYVEIHQALHGIHHRIRLRRV